ncbi:YokU family protein [Neobacillus niacini]|uniref:YokU family protein n=1 Tax=Neobacillus niacini TaxID=86668 RepID=UPI0039836BAD
MELVCEWCKGAAENGKNTVYWELPDGTRAIQITDTPAVVCNECQMVYQTDVITKEIEDQLFLIDTKKIGNSISYKDLMSAPRLLKRNYFDFSS